eukprot:1549322-Pyramimonas_sp.AAC.1
MWRATCSAQRSLTPRFLSVTKHDSSLPKTTTFSDTRMDGQNFDYTAAGCKRVNISPCSYSRPPNKSVYSMASGGPICEHLSIVIGNATKHRSCS